MASSLFDERMVRLMKTVALEATDRTPVMLEYAGFAAAATGMSFAEFAGDPLKGTDAMIETFKKVGGADGLDYGSYTPALLSFIWLSKVLVSGEHLPADEPWQVQEIELMKPEDYDKIVDMGWEAFFPQFLESNIKAGLMEQFGGFVGIQREVLQKWGAVDAPIMQAGTITTPYEMFCGGRTMPKFIFDLYRMPDKVEKAMEAAAPYMAPQAIDLTKQLGLPAIWIGGWRSASEMLARSLWERFVWPYFKRIANEVLDAGIIPLFHLDSSWTRDLEMFKEFPAGKCIISFDGSTDIVKAKEILGDTMCIMGDVPASLFSHGTPEDVYDYCRNNIKKIGPTGYIIHSGCDIPIDAKVENVSAMMKAAEAK